MIDGLTPEQIKRLVPTLSKQKFIRAIQKHFPDMTMDFTLDDNSDFVDPLTQQHWKFYCQGKEDQAWYSPAGHVIARVTPIGIQIAKRARVLRHTAQVKKIIAGLRARHGGEYLTLSIIAADIQRIKHWLQAPSNEELTEFQVRVVDHDKTVSPEPKKQNHVGDPSVNPQRR